MPNNGNRHLRVANGNDWRRARPHRDQVQEVRQRERERKTLKMLRREVRKKVLKEKLGWTELQIEREAQRRWAAGKKPEHPHLEAELRKTIPTTVAPHRAAVRRLPELHAVRGLKVVRNMEEALRSCAHVYRSDVPTEVKHAPWSSVKQLGGPMGRSGRTANRKVPVALFESQAMLPGTPNLLAAWDTMLDAGDPCAHWALGWPRSDGGPSSYNKACPAMDTMLGSTDPTWALALNLEGFQQVRRIVGDEDLGRFCAVDGMFIPAAREQGPSLTSEEEELLNRGLDIGFGWHGDHGCRGWSMVAITCVKSNLCLGWLLRPAKKREFTDLLPLVRLIFWLWPDWPLEVLSGDSEYDTAERESEKLETVWCAHPAFHKRGEWSSEYDHAETGGVPVCGQAGHGHMKLNWSQNWLSGASGRAMRREQGIPDGVPIEAYDWFHRWYCEKCFKKNGRKDEVATYPQPHPVTNPGHVGSWRVHTYLPFEGGHRRVGLRLAMGARRNSSESLNAMLQSWGVGLSGRAGPFWVNRTAEMHWLVGGALFGNTARRLAHESGAYQESLDYAIRKRWLQPPQPEPKDLLLDVELDDDDDADADADDIAA